MLGEGAIAAGILLAGSRPRTALGGGSRYNLRTRRGGFTLVELLVVIAVIAILAALLLPALASAKHSAQSTICRNNLRQLSIGFEFYTDTHHAFPPLEPPSGELWPHWTARLELPMSYIETKWLDNPPRSMRRLGGIFQCPLNVGKVITVHFSGPGGPAWGTEQVRMPSWTSYGYNAWAILGGSTPAYPNGLGLGGGAWPVSAAWLPTPESAVRAPSDMIALGDEFLRSRNAALDAALNGAGTIAPVTTCPRAPVDDSTVPPKRQPTFLAHRGKASRAFVDGHVESEEMQKVFAAKDAQLRRWNVDNEAHRELLAD